MFGMLRCENAPLDEATSSTPLLNKCKLTRPTAVKGGGLFEKDVFLRGVARGGVSFKVNESVIVKYLAMNSVYKRWCAGRNRRAADATFIFILLCK